MTTVTKWIPKQATSALISGIATIDSGETASLAVPCNGHGVVRIGIPSTFTGTAISFTVTPYPGATAQTLKDSVGNTVSKTVAASEVVNVPELTGAFSFTIVSNASEGGARALDVQCVGLDPTVPGDRNVITSVAPISSSTTNGYSVATTITRPANATPYTANDVLGGALDLGVLGPSAGKIIVTSSRLDPHIAAVPSGMTFFTLYLYNVTPPSAIADNSPWTLATADLSAYLGSINLGTPALPAASSNSLTVQTTQIGLELPLAGTHLFGYLVTAGGFTPAGNSEVYVATLSTVAV